MNPLIMTARIWEATERKVISPLQLSGKTMSQ
jgi:hypothetical protein